jgi:hypothetical protein
MTTSQLATAQRVDLLGQIVNGLLSSGDFTYVNAPNGCPNRVNTKRLIAAAGEILNAIKEELL